MKISKEDVQGLEIPDFDIYEIIFSVKQDKQNIYDTMFTCEAPFNLFGSVAQRHDQMIVPGVDLDSAVKVDFQFDEEYMIITSHEAEYEHIIRLYRLIIKHIDKYAKLFKNGNMLAQGDHEVTELTILFGEELNFLEPAGYFYVYADISDHWYIDDDEKVHLAFNRDIFEDPFGNQYFTYFLQTNLHFAGCLMGLNIRQAYDNYRIVTDQVDFQRLFKCKECKKFYVFPTLCFDEIGHCKHRYCEDCIQIHFNQITCDHDNSDTIKIEHDKYYTRKCKDCDKRYMEIE